MITNAMIKTPRDTPGKPSRKVSQSQMIMSVDSDRIGTLAQQTITLGRVWASSNRSSNADEQNRTAPDQLTSERLLMPKDRTDSGGSKHG